MQLGRCRAALITGLALPTRSPSSGSSEKAFTHENRTRQIETLIYFVSGAEAGRGCPLRVNMGIFQHLRHEFKSLTSSL